ncbi:MAG: ARMT1-like domain-containing protein [Candidatus Bathycorpusculaceae bacterium]
MEQIAQECCLRIAPRKFLEELYNSNLVISKGQGNYESLSEIKHKEIFFS